MPWEYTLEELAHAICARTFRNGRDPRNITFSRVSTDTRKLEPGDVFFALTGERFDANQFIGLAIQQGAAAAVCTPAGLEHAQGATPLLVVPDVLKALQRFAQWHRERVQAPVMAITGSCGKTTTKELTAGLLASKYPVVKTEGNLNNEIGCPLSLLRLDRSTGIAVIEMGANHAGEIARLCEIAQPNESAITMIGPAHLEGFGSIDNVAKAKAEIAMALPEDGIFYANMDDPRCAAIAQRVRSRVVRVGQAKNPVFANGQDGDVVVETALLDASGELEVRIRDVGTLRLPLNCLAHAANVAMAVAVARQHGITEFEEPLRSACAGVTRFRRLQVGPLIVIDDTYNANPASMEAALDTLRQTPASGSRLAALGDMLELGECSEALHEALGECAARNGVDWLFVRGAFADSVVAGAKRAGLDHVEAVDAHAAIAQRIHGMAKSGDVLLVKGSRGMKMERVIEALKTLYA